MEIINPDFATFVSGKEIELTPHNRNYLIEAIHSVGVFGQELVSVFDVGNVQSVWIIGDESFNKAAPFESGQLTKLQIREMVFFVSRYIRENESNAFIAYAIDITPSYLSCGNPIEYYKVNGLTRIVGNDVFFVFDAKTNPKLLYEGIEELSSSFFFGFAGPFSKDSCRNINHFELLDMASKAVWVSVGVFDGDTFAIFKPAKGSSAVEEKAKTKPTMEKTTQLVDAGGDATVFSVLPTSLKNGERHAGSEDLRLAKHEHRR